MTDQQADCISDALELAVNLLSLHEPGDSRAVSDEFVALAAVSVGDMSPEVMAVIRNALNRGNKGASPHEVSGGIK